jgi:hypothetical protein
MDLQKVFNSRLMRMRKPGMKTRGVCEKKGIKVDQKVYVG